MLLYIELSCLPFPQLDMLWDREVVALRGDNRQTGQMAPVDALFMPCLHVIFRRDTLFDVQESKCMRPEWRQLLDYVKGYTGIC